MEQHSMIELDDLPDEILMMIFKHMCKNDVLYSLIDVNQRLSSVVHDPFFTNHLTLLEHSSNDSINPLADTMLERLCSQILPKIGHKIKRLDLESSSMERILLSTNYSNLDELSLYNMGLDTVKKYFIDKNPLIDLFNKQILSLTFDMTVNKMESSKEIFNGFTFQCIMEKFSNIQYLNLCASSIWHSTLSTDIFYKNLASSTLLELHVTVRNFSDCLYFLDGRFSQLHTLHINIADISYSQLKHNKTENLPNLKSFSLYSNTVTNVYDEFVIPLLNRMVNLEELGLYIKVSDRNIFIDGNDLKNNVINNMLRLKKIQFYIRSNVVLSDRINLPSNYDIQNTFKDFTDNKIICWTDYFADSQQGQCHVYTDPYTLNEYCKISNNFPGGLFKNVTKILLYDEQPFEHDFFLRISQSFPLVKKIIVENMKPQKSDKNQNLPIIEYPQLTLLDLTDAHLDYIELFLLHTKMSLSNNVHMVVLYQALRRVTEKFKRNSTRTNCEKLFRLRIIGKYRIPKYVKEYFPHTEIIKN